MSYNYQGKKFLSLPEQVEMNKRNIEQLKRDEYRTFTTLLAIENLTYLELNQLVENSRNVSVGDLIYGSDAYYGQVTRVGGSVVEFTTVGFFGRPNMVNITYQELKDLRDNEKLDSGTFYRITDYETTTVQDETRSAGNLFDVIVQALDNKTLSENAQAIQSERDVSGYFDGMRLEAWKLKYTLENDRLRYYWADTVNGKGVIYRMIDEYDNDLPYDFKNIQFKRYMIDEYTENTELVGRYFALKNMDGSVIPSGAEIDVDFIWAYTFTVIDENGIVNDVSLNKNKTFMSDEGIYYYTKNNKIGSFDYDYYDEIEEISKRKETLGNNVILYDYDYYGYWEFYGFHTNTIGNYFNHNTIGHSFGYNTIGNYFNSNTIGNNFSYNTIGNDFNSNTIGNNFNYNTIGNYFNSNTIGNNFNYNTIGDEFKYNTITIGNYFNSNTIGNNFYFNTIVNYFSYNTIGNDFSYNTIGNDFNRNTIGNYNRYLKTEDKTNTQRIQFIHIENGVSGNSTSNQLDLTDTGTILTGNSQTTPTIISKDSLGWLMLKRDGLTFTGKRKTTISGSWGDL